MFFNVAELDNGIVKNVSLGVTNRWSTEKTDGRALSDSVFCVGGHYAIANQAWATKILLDDIHRQVRYHWRISSISLSFGFLPHSAPKQEIMR